MRLLSSDEPEINAEPSFDDLIHSSPYHEHDLPFLTVSKLKRFYRLARLYSPVYAAVELFSSPETQIRAIFFYHYKFSPDPSVKDYVRPYLRRRRVTLFEISYILASHQHKSVKEIARELNRSPKTIYAVLHRHGIKKRRYRHLTESEISYIINQYLYQKRSIYSIAKELGRPPSTIYNVLKRLFDREYFRSSPHV